MGGETVAKGMAADFFGDLGDADSGFNGFLNATFVKVMATGFGRAAILAATNGRKNVLPDPFALRMGVFALKGIGQIDGSVALL
jgi:hypothetical protein